MDKAFQLILSALAIVTKLRGLAASPDYALAVLALLMDSQGKGMEAANTYRLVLAEPFGAASRWFDDQFGRFIPNSQPALYMQSDERWLAIEHLYQSLL